MPHKTKLISAIAGFTLATFSTALTPAMAQAECLIGEVRMFAGNFAPRGWFLADGRLLSISTNSTLFSILGTTYGGDGRTTFALPDLRGRAAVGTGAGAGLTPRSLGQKFGSEKVQSPSVSIATTTGTSPVTVGGISSSVVQPSLGVNYIICAAGLYPSRS